MVRVLQEDLQNALRQIDELKAINMELEEKLLPAVVGKGHTVSAKCMVVGDTVLHSVGTEHADTMMERFPGIKTERLHRVTEKTDLGSAETVIIHVGTNDLRRTINIDFVMGEVRVYAERELPNCGLP